MDNTIPFNPTSCTVRTEQITVDVSILSVLNHAASPGRQAGCQYLSRRYRPGHGTDHHHGGRCAPHSALL